MCCPANSGVDGRYLPSPPTGQSRGRSYSTPIRKVFVTVPRRGVHGARPRLGGDVLAEHDGHDAVVEGMPELQSLEGGPAGRTHHGPIPHPEACRHALEHVLGDEQALPALADIGLHQGILQRSVQGHGPVARQRPRRGGPDRDRRRAIRCGGAQRIAERAANPPRQNEHPPRRSACRCIPPRPRPTRSGSSRHQCTGLYPRNTRPRSSSFENARSCSAS